MVIAMTQISYRVAVRDDETDIMDLLKEVAPEIPVPLEPSERQEPILQYIIIQCRESGMSWVAVDESEKVVGFALARQDFHENGAISLRYIGVSESARQHGICSTLIAKLKANGAPLTTSVLDDNRSQMADRLKKKGFVIIESGAKETKLRWAPPPS